MNKNVERTAGTALAEARGSERVPQYDLELRCAARLIEEWKEVAFRLYSVRGCHKNEHRRIRAEAAYLRLAQNTEVRHGAKDADLD